jgi:formate/nitrite transporter FocA (FNT family)
MASQPTSLGPEAEPSQSRPPREATEKSPGDVYRPIMEKGEVKLQRPTLDLVFSGLVAGLDISFGALAMAIVAGRLHQSFGLHLKAALLLGAFFYPLGFLVVILGRSELFTENTLTPVAGLLRAEGTVLGLARYWSIVYCTNIVGVVLFSLLVSHIDVAFTPYLGSYRAIGTPLVAQPFLQSMLAGVLAGWLVALIAWLVEATHGDLAHILVIYVTAYLIAGLGLFHCIIGSAEVLLAMFAGAPITWDDWLLRFLAPVTLGNIIGGAVFVTVLKGVQAKAGAEQKAG